MAGVIYDRADPDARFLEILVHNGTGKWHILAHCPAVWFRMHEMTLTLVPVPRDDHPYLVPGPVELCRFCFGESPTVEVFDGDAVPT